jgi:hypothetical protein
MGLSVFLLIATLVMAPGISGAQMHGGSGQQHMMGGQGMMGQGMMSNMSMMSNMMGQMQQMWGQGHMTPQQQKQMWEIMNQMGGVMQQMGGPQGAKMQARHQGQLHRMQRRLEELKAQMRSQPKSGK